MIEIRTALKRSRVVALVGPRQCGKTTMARRLVREDSLNYFDLEDPDGRARLEQPMSALRPLRGVVVIDEVQRFPDLFPVLRVLADRRPLPSRFLVLGSASPGMLRQSSESLAGRVETVVMGGFDLTEVAGKAHPHHWLRGGLPLAYLARTDADSFRWRKQFIQTFLDRDVGRFGFHIPSTALLRFWTMAAHFHGQVWNSAQPARSLGISESSVRRYLDLLSDLLMIRQLPPWHANLKKRQVKAPKLYFRDSGLLHALLGLRTQRDLLSHPACGSSWEGYIVEEILRSLVPDEAYFWRSYQGAEIDLVLVRGGRLYGVEIKREDAPRMGPSLRIALEDLGLERIAVVYPGLRRYALHDRIETVPFPAITEGWKGLFS